jgi:uncharacterized membrane protein YtjA (UPF0391 family)
MAPSVSLAEREGYGSSGLGDLGRACGNSLERLWFNKEEAAMLSWALAFFIIAIIAAVFGFGGIAAGAAQIAQILFFIFLVLFVVSLLVGVMRRPPV